MLVVQIFQLAAGEYQLHGSVKETKYSHTFLAKRNAIIIDVNKWSIKTFLSSWLYHDKGIIEQQGRNYKQKDLYF